MFIFDKIFVVFFVFGVMVNDVVWICIFIIDEVDVFDIFCVYGCVFLDVKLVNILVVVVGLIGDYKVEIEVEVLV